MKNVKAKNIFLGLLATMALAVMLVSCEQNSLEDLAPTAEEQLTEIEDRVPTAPAVALSAAIVGTWSHSYEEDTNLTVENTYRPYGFNFPLSRGRKGLRFSPNGNFIYLYNGPADEPLEATGTWRAFGSQRILISFDAPPNGQQIPFRPIIKVISVSNDKLVIEPLNWNFM